MNSATLKVVVAGDAGGASKALRQVRGDTEKTQSKLSKFAKIGGAAILAGAAVVAGVAASSVKAAIEDQKSASILANTLSKTTGATKTQVAAVEDWIDKTQRATGIADDELRPALGNLLRSTGDVTKSQKLLSTAMDVATATGKPLESVSVALAKAYGGNTTALGKLGIKTKDAAGQALSFDQIQQQLTEKMGGSTAAAANTLQGKMDRAKIAFGEAQEKIGYALIPILTKLATFVTDKLIPGVESVVGWFSKHKAITITLASVLGALTVAIGTYLVAMKVAKGVQLAIKAATTAWTAAQWLLNVALNANPIGLVVLAIGALIAATVLVVKNWKTLSRWAGNVWGAIKSAFGGVASFFTSAFDKVTDIITAPFRAAFNMVIDLWNGTIGKLAHGQNVGVGPFKLELPDLRIPKLHDGGVFHSGRGEGFALLRDGETVFTPAQMRGLALAGGGSGGDVIVNLPAGANGADVVRAARRYKRRNGKAA